MHRCIHETYNLTKNNKNKYFKTKRLYRVFLNRNVIYFCSIRFISH